jgi:hypothetical protein
MESNVKLSEVVNLAKTTGVLGWFKINDASKVVANAKGTYQINTSIFMKNFVQKEFGDEIIFFGKKQLNVSKLEKSLLRFVGLNVSFFVGGKLFAGKLTN